MLTKGLLALFGIIGCPTKKWIKVKDLKEFSGLIHVISDPIVVKVYEGNDQHERNALQRWIGKDLESKFGMMLSPNYDNMTLSKNQVNIVVSGMS